MRKLGKMTRRRFVTILSLAFVLALTATTALAATPRFSSALTFTLTSSSTSTAQTFTAGLYNSSSSNPTILVAHGDLENLVEGQTYKVVIDAKGKAEVVCRSDDDSYHGSSPKTVDVTASGSTTLSPSGSSGEASFDVAAEDLKIDSKRVCSSHYDDNHKPRVTILKVLYSSGDVTLFGPKGSSSTTIDPAVFAPSSHDKSQRLDEVKFSKCKTKDSNVYCKQTGVDD